VERVFLLALQDQHILEEENEVRSLVEGREHGKGLVHLDRTLARIRVTCRSGARKVAQMQDFPRQDIADACDRAGCAAIDEAVKDRGIDADHQRDLVVAAGDVLGGIAQVVGSAEFLEADKVPVLGAQREKEVGAGREAVIGAVVYDGRQGRGSRQDGLEMRLLGGDDRAARKNAGDDHQALRPDLLGMRGMRHRGRRIDRAGSHDERDACLHQMLDAFHALRVGQERPVAHRAAVDDGGHAGGDELLALAHQRVEIRRAVVVAGGHQGGNRKNACCHDSLRFGAARLDAALAH